MLRYDWIIRVYTTADTDTSTLCVGVPATYINRPGKITWRMQLIGNGWHMLTISNTQTHALSQFYDWLICRNVRVIHSWLLLSLPAGGGSAAWWSLRQYCAIFVSQGGWYQVTVSFCLPPLQPSPVSWTIKQHAHVRGRMTGRLNALWSSCVMRSVNSWWTCSDARNIGRYNSSRYDSIRYTDLIIVRSLILSITQLNSVKLNDWSRTWQINAFKSGLERTKNVHIGFFTDS